MTDDLVERLRDSSRYDSQLLMREAAADRIERLEQQLLTATAFLEDALGRIDIENPAHSIWGDLCGFVIRQSKMVIKGMEDD